MGLSLRTFFATRWYAGLAVVLLACLAFLAADVGNRRFTMVDLPVFARAGARVLGGENLYRPAEDGFYEYKYGPTAALYFTPLTLLPYPATKVAWWLLLSAVVTGNFLLALRLARPGWRADPPGRVNRVVLLAALAVAVHFQLDLHLGQVNQLLLFLYLLAANAFADRRPAAFGLAAAASLFLKPFALIFAPYLLLRRRWRELAWTAGLALPLALAPRLLYSAADFAAQYRGWADRIGEEMAKKADLLAPGNHTLLSIAARYTPLRLLAGQPAAAGAMRLLLLAALAGLLLWYVRRGAALERPEAGDFAALLALVPLLAFTSYNAFGAAMPAAVVLLWHLDRLGAFRGVAVAGMVLLGGNVYDLWGRALSFRLNDLSLVAIGATLLLAALVKGRSAGAF